MSDSYDGAQRSKIAFACNRFRGSGAQKICVVVAMCIGTITNPMAGGRSQSVPVRAAFDPPTLTDAQSLFYNARYEAAGHVAAAGHLGGHLTTGQVARLTSFSEPATMLSISVWAAAL